MVKGHYRRTRRRVREAIADETQGARYYSSLAKAPGLNKTQRTTIRAMAGDERRHRRNSRKIYKELK